MADRDESLPDFAALLRELLGPDAQLPPEMEQFLAAMQGGGDASPQAAMLQHQLGLLFGDGGEAARLSGATDLARKVVAAGGERSITEGARRDVQAAVDVARLWVDPVTSFDSPGGPTRAWSRAEWVEATMPTWVELLEPVATGVASAGSAAMRKQLDALGASGELPDLASLGLPEELTARIGAQGMSMDGLLRQFTPALERVSAGLFTAQIGHAVGALAADVVSGTEVGLPVVPDQAITLLPAAIEEFAEGLGLEVAEVRLYLAVREAARVRLFTQVPWLAANLEAGVRDYGRNITIDTDAIESAVSSVDFTDADAMQEAFAQAQLFGRAPTPAQQAALARLETTLALVEGWVDLVTDQAVAAHLPHAAALGEAVRRRRLGGPAQKAFSGFVGLQLSPRRLRDARNLWAALEAAGGLDLRDGSWAHPDLAPTAGDLDDPLGYVERRRTPAAPDAMDAEIDSLLASFGDEPPTAPSA